ncbi:transcription factor-like protein DPA isoform X2 [Carica papaya]|uniref:transcription factor-like protein DPA isoform X2 n=1 Tax=Carica papaya TaxID=3649 RepID=UPI000B8D13A4|nr:transcription factor-like protein DPA isoform X2 [Carica papaya]
MASKYLDKTQLSEQCPFGSSKSPRQASSSESTPVLNKMAVLNHGRDNTDVSNSSANKKKVSRVIGGLRQFSVLVCKTLETKGTTTYSEVADEIVAEFAAIQSNAAASSEEFNEKNIRRRVYDALNVLMALDIITRDKKEICWKGLPTICTKDLEEMKKQRAKLITSIVKKTAYLKDLEEQIAGIQNLILRNHQLLKSNKAPAEGFTLPFILVQTSPHASVEIEISEDMQLVHFDFNSTPFALHDDSYILKLMQNYQHPQRSSSRSSSSSCIASGGTNYEKDIR